MASKASKSDPAALARKLDALRAGLDALGPCLIAVSGGLDSRFLAHMAWAGNARHHAVFFSGPHMTPGEIKACRAWLDRSGQAFHIVEFSPLDIPDARANLRDRCYHCKLASFARGQGLRQELGLNFLLDGSNASDLKEFRPGRRALQDLAVRSPLAEHALTKEEIRRAAWELGLGDPGQPSRACLLTRFEYGYAPDPTLMTRIGRAEDALMALGVLHFRLRALRDGRFLLQLALSEKKIWELNQEQGLRILRSAGVDAPELLFAERVSGYFDAKP
jgi:uncharacterized protein